jgi:hypothetical protein
VERSEGASCQRQRHVTSSDPESLRDPALRGLRPSRWRSLLPELDKRKDGKDELRKDVAERLRKEVKQMNVNNFIVRPKRKQVEKYTDAKAWEKLDADERNELVTDVAGLTPSPERSWQWIKEGVSK